MYVCMYACMLVCMCICVYENIYAIVGPVRNESVSLNALRLLVNVTDFNLTSRRW